MKGWLVPKAYPLVVTIGGGKIVLANPNDRGETEIQAAVEGQVKVRIDGSHLALQQFL